MGDRLGQQIGNYRLVRLLGKGGFAEVYLGQHVHLASKQAAIKILHLLDVDVRKFQEEAETTEKLVHPHIVRLLDFDIEQGTPFLVLDYAPGGSLRTRHPKGSMVPLATVGAYLKELAPALQYAHDLHILHRDIKPDNVLIGRQGELLLSDFGIAVLTLTGRTSFPSAYGIGGTPYYMAPETYRGRPVKESDQYALAVVVYEWLCGSVPFTEGDFIQLGYQHSHEPLPALREKNPAIPPGVEAVIRKALSKEPRDRFASVRAFAHALEQANQPAKSHFSVLSQGPTIPDQPQQPARKASPLMPLSRRTVALQPSEVVHTSPDQAQQTSDTSDTLNRPVPAHLGISRRTIVLGLGVAGLAVAGGGLTWLLSSGKFLPPSFPGLTLTPTPIPLGTTLYTYRGHSTYVNAVAWSPDGRRIAAGGFDHTVQVWDAADGRNVYTYRGHSGIVEAVAWSPDGKRIASGGDDGTVQVWDAADGGNVYTYRGQGPYMESVAWSPDGRRIVSGSDGWAVQVWDADGGGNVYTYRGHSPGVHTVAWSPNGKRIASGGDDGTVQVWDADGGGNVYTYHGHSTYVEAVAWSPNGRRIASGGADTTVQVWDAADGGNVYTYRRHSNWVYAVSWSPNGQRIASGSWDKTVQVWDAADGRNVYTYRGHSNYVTAVAWSPDGRRIVSGSNDTTVQVWQAV